MAENKFQKSLAEGFHHDLQKICGNWKGNTKTWFEPNVVADESEIKGTIRSILDGRFIIHEYKGSLQGKPLEGVAIFGCNLDTNKFQVAWVDSFHMSTGILFSESAKTSTQFSALGSWPAGDQIWGWRTNLEIISPDNIILTMYILTPEGEESIATETNYVRV